MGSVVLPVAAKVGIANNEAAKTLRDQVEQFRAQGPATAPDDSESEPGLSDFGVQAKAVRVYTSPQGDLFRVEVVRTLNDSAAYSLLTAHRTNSQEIKPGFIGTAGFVEPARIAFFKGPNFITVTSTDNRNSDTGELIALARRLAKGLDPSEDDIPVLVKHLPYWQTSQPWAYYAVSSNGLKQHVQGQPILNEVSFEGGAEAVAARYGV